MGGVLDKKKNTSREFISEILNNFHLFTHIHLHSGK